MYSRVYVLLVLLVCHPDIPLPKNTEQNPEDWNLKGRPQWTQASSPNNREEKLKQDQEKPQETSIE